MRSPARPSARVIWSPFSPSEPETRSPAWDDRLGDQAAGVVEILRQPLMGAADREFHPLGIADDGLALRHQLVDQRAQADFVVGIGALERRDLAAHDGLQFAGTRHGALDAVAHRGDLAADGLAQRQDRIGADDFGLGQAQRHLGHRPRDQPHLLGPAIERRQHEEEHDGRAGGERQQRPLAEAEARRSASGTPAENEP